MSQYLLAAVTVLVLINIGLAIAFWLFNRGVSPQRLDDRFGSLEKGLERTERLVREEIAKNREEATANARTGREEVSRGLSDFSQNLLSRLAENTTWQKSQFDAFSSNLTTLTESNQQRLEKMRETVETKLAAMQESAERSGAANRDEVGKSLKAFSDTFSTNLKALTDTNSQELQKLRELIERQLKELQKDNAQKLDQMRATVDEKLHETLERRLGESFKLVSERLESVYKGLGEMQTLAAGVGDLKRVFTNIKTRGGWGEIQLGTLLEQLLSPDQYEANVAPNPHSSERVEYAIKLPGGDDSGGAPLYLPIDAKFPLEDYQRLLDAQEASDAVKVEEAAKALETRIKLEAKNIRDKYISPPHTTDFAILFLPVEGLYAEILRRPGLADTVQHDYRVAMMGPTTLGAILNALQMGFRTLAIQKRSSEVWEVLGAVKTEFGKFGDMLDKVEKKLHEASGTIEQAKTRTRVMERKLKDVQELPPEDSARLLGPMDAVATEAAAEDDHPLDLPSA